MPQDLSFIGRNIRRLRRRAGLTLNQLAATAGLNPVVLGRIERGINAPSAAAIVGLSKALAVSADSFFAADEPGAALAAAESASPFLVSMDQRQESLPMAVQRTAQQLIETFWALEDICGVPKHANIPLNLPFEPSPSGMARLAADLRRIAGIGHGIVFDYFELFETLGLRVLVLPLPKEVESLSYHDIAHRNAFFFLNARINAERKLFKLSYELGKVLIVSPSPGAQRPCFVPDGPDKPFTAHRAARHFAACFLMPEQAVRDTVGQLGLAPGRWTMDLLLRIKHRFGVSAEAFLYRLEELGLIEAHDLDALKDQIYRYYESTGFKEPDFSRRLLTPNGRIWDLVLTAGQNPEVAAELEDIKKRLHSLKVVKI